MVYLYQPFPIWGSGSIREKLTRLYELEERKESVKCLLDVVWLLDTSPYRSCGCLHNTYKDQVIDNSSIVVRTWSKGNTHSLLVGVKTCIHTMEISASILSEHRNLSTSRSIYTILGHIPKGCFILSKGNLVKHVHWCITNYNQNLETA